MRLKHSKKPSNKPKAKRNAGMETKAPHSFDFGPDLMTFNNIIWCAGNAGKFDLAKSLFTQLLNDDREKKLSPNVYTYGPNGYFYWCSEQL